MPTTGLNSQTAPYPIELADLVERLSYRAHEGWQVSLEEIDRDKDQAGAIIGRGLTLVVLTKGFDSYNPKVELHECMEHFVVDGERPFAPLHGPGCDPYVVHEYASDEQRRTRFTGDVVPG